MSETSKRGSKKPKRMERKKASSDADGRSETRKKSEWIGQQVRDVYDETLSEPVPERFKELLRQLDDKSGQKE